METVRSSGLTNQFSSESSSKIQSMAKVSTCGVMDVSMKVIGISIKCMAKGSTLGAMGASTMGNIWMTKSTASENFHGPMVASTKVSGSKESSMAWVCIQLAKARKGTGSGETASCTKLLKNKTNKIKHKKNYERENYKIAKQTKYVTCRKSMRETKKLKSDDQL